MKIIEVFCFFQAGAFGMMNLVHWNGIMISKMATLRWKIRAFTEMLRFDKIIFITL